MGVEYKLNDLFSLRCEYLKKDKKNVLRCYDPPKGLLAFPRAHFMQCLNCSKKNIVISKTGTIAKRMTTM